MRFFFCLLIHPFALFVFLCVFEALQFHSTSDFKEEKENFYLLQSLAKVFSLKAETSESFFAKSFLFSSLLHHLLGEIILKLWSEKSAKNQLK